MTPTEVLEAVGEVATISGTGMDSIERGTHCLVAADMFVNSQSVSLANATVPQLSNLKTTVFLSAWFPAKQQEQLLPFFCATV